MKYPIVAAVAMTALLSACGSSDDDDEGGVVTTPGGRTPTSTATPLETTGPASRILAGSEATSITFDETENELIVTSIPFDGEQFPSEYVRVPANDVGRYRAFADKDGLDTYRGYHGVSDSGNASVSLVVTGSYSDHGYYGAQFNRDVGVSLPTSTQKGFYTGDYLGARTDGTGPATLDVITGRTELEVDFSDSAVRGRIYNRVAVQNQSGGAVDSQLIFTDSSLNREGGDYSGTVFTNDGTAISTVGTYDGALVGTNATETVGIVQITDGSLRETGIYTAKQ